MISKSVFIYRRNKLQGKGGYIHGAVKKGTGRVL